jgi:hypothetical protein
MTPFGKMVSDPKYTGYQNTLQYKQDEDKKHRKKANIIRKAIRKKRDDEMEIEKKRKKYIDDYSESNNTADSDPDRDPDRDPVTNGHDLYNVNDDNDGSDNNKINQDESSDDDDDDDGRPINDISYTEQNGQVILNCRGSNCTLCFLTLFGEKDVQDIIVMNWTGISYRAFEKRPFTRLSLFRCNIMDDDVDYLRLCSLVSYFECMYVTKKKIDTCKNTSVFIRK